MGVFKRTTKRNDKKREYWYIDYVLNGKRKWESVGKVGLVTKSDAKKLLELRKSEILQGKFKTKKQNVIPTFSEFAKEYLEYAKQNKKSWDRDMYSLRKLEPFFGNYKLTEISPIQIERYKLDRLKLVSTRTVNIELVLLKRMFYLAISWDKCEINPMHKVNFLKQSGPRERILSYDEEEKLLESSTDHLKPILITALQTGMRYGEILSLTWEDVDLEREYIHIKESKSGKGRNIPINETLKKVLQELNSEHFVSNSVGTEVLEAKKGNDFSFSRRRRAGFRIQYREVWGFDSPFSHHINLLFTYRGKPRKSIRTAFKNACIRAGIKSLRFHDLRHTFATRLVLSGVDLVTVSKLLGHSTIQMTMRYSHPTDNTKPTK